MRGDDDAVGADLEPRRRQGAGLRRQRFEATPAPTQDHDDRQQDGAENHQNTRHHRLEDTVVVVVVVVVVMVVVVICVI